MFLNANTPEELRAAVANADPLARIQIECDVDAVIEAKMFERTKLRCSSEWIRYMREHEPFFSDALTNVELGIQGNPIPGRAVLVLSSPRACTDVDGERFWMHAMDLLHIPDRVSVSTQNDLCHRCSDWEGVEPKTVDWVFHVATAKYVVEFALCTDCTRFYDDTLTSQYYRERGGLNG